MPEKLINTKENTKMSYEEFKSELFRSIVQQEEVKGKLVRLLEKGFTSWDFQMRNIIRYINLTCFGKDSTVMQEDFIHVTWGEGSIINMIQWNMRECFDKYKREGWPGVIPEILAKLQKVSDSTSKFHINGTYEQCRSRLVIRPINYESNKYELEDCIYWRNGDIALTLYGVVHEDEEDYITLKINREISAKWNKSDDCMLTGALLNSFIKMPPRLYYATDMREKHEFSDGCFMPEDVNKGIQIHGDIKIEGTLGYRLTTSRGLNGALAIFYPGVQERLHEIMGEDYFVGFTSIHEAVIHPISRQSAADIKESIKSINAVFPVEEMLTNQVYRYCGERKELIEL